MGSSYTKIESVSTVIQKFLNSTLPDNAVAKSLGRDDSLSEKIFSTPQILLLLIEYIETTYSLSIEPDEIIPDNFDTIKRIERFIHKKKVN